MNTMFNLIKFYYSPTSRELERQANTYVLYIFFILAFSITNRKHHCRNCGQIFCADCSVKQATMPNYKKPQRVCEPCFAELQQGKWQDSSYGGNISRSSNNFQRSPPEEPSPSNFITPPRSTSRSSLWNEQVH